MPEEIHRVVIAAEEFIEGLKVKGRIVFFGRSVVPGYGGRPAYMIVWVEEVPETA